MARMEHASDPRHASDRDPRETAPGQKTETDETAITSTSTS
eukprot:CAMPEP_0183332392 /NCGR_PEP_ID=MMETSP0164_2-20130417/1575_1 /TAXON_ID=221442 /ORGANISM="Coccolithus pelagicus ssp braarudi, Strain PLY182g" /LENGTH=40 /DNA_ID= /DNA_START= /DNA_END= /DNA_ORIENTATION=